MRNRACILDQVQVLLQIEAATGEQRCCHVRRFLFQKRLSASDTGPLGRVVLPRAAAEAFLPRLPDRRGGGTPLTLLDARSGMNPWVAGVSASP